MNAAVVTGASRGIGLAIGHALAAAGCDVVLAARDSDALHESARSVAAASGRRTHAVAADLATEAGIATLAAKVAALCPAVHVLVNNAGATVRGNLSELDEADWQAGFGLKFMAAVRLTRALWPSLVAAQGSVVNIAGIAGRTPTADFVLGAAVNAAVMSLTKSLAEQGRRDGVRVNCINPGLIRTGRLQARIDALAARDGLDADAAERALAAAWGVPRIGRPEEIAALAVFLTVGGGTYCQGGIYDVDGGATRGI